MTISPWLPGASKDYKKLWKDLASLGNVPDAMNPQITIYSFCHCCKLGKKNRLFSLKEQLKYCLRLIIFLLLLLDDVFCCFSSLQDQVSISANAGKEAGAQPKMGGGRLCLFSSLHYFKHSVKLQHKWFVRSSNKICHIRKLALPNLETATPSSGTSFWAGEGEHWAAIIYWPSTASFCAVDVCNSPAAAAMTAARS